MIYKVTANYLEDKASEFYRKLTDGTIANQKPDGHEILDSMQRAKITGPKTIEWYETCYCQTPLVHERATVYDHYLTEMDTLEVDDYGTSEGDSFWDYLEGVAAGS